MCFAISKSVLDVCCTPITYLLVPRLYTFKYPICIPFGISLIYLLASHLYIIGVSLIYLWHPTGLFFIPDCI